MLRPHSPLESTSAFLRDRPFRRREPRDTPSSLLIVQGISAAAHHLVKVAVAPVAKGRPDEAGKTLWRNRLGALLPILGAAAMCTVSVGVSVALIDGPVATWVHGQRRGLPQSIVWRNGLVVMKWQPVGGLAELERGVRQRVYAFIATIATSVRFFAFSFLMTLRTWTFTVLKHMFNSWAIILFDLPCWIARTTESSRLVRMQTRERVVDAGGPNGSDASRQSGGT
jgi:hypothetical protein